MVSLYHTVSLVTSVLRKEQIFQKLVNSCHLYVYIASGFEFQVSSFWDVSCHCQWPYHPNPNKGYIPSFFGGMVEICKVLRPPTFPCGFWHLLRTKFLLLSCEVFFQAATFRIPARSQRTPKKVVFWRYFCPPTGYGHESIFPLAFGLGMLGT